MQKFDIPINFTVVSTTEDKAVNQLMEFLIAGIREFGATNRIADFELFEFLPNEDDDNDYC